MNVHDELRKLGFSDNQIAGAFIDGKPIADAPKKKTSRFAPYKSKWEAMYAAECQSLLGTGEILQWEYEPFSLKLTEPRTVNGNTQPGARYTPDFVLWLSNLQIMCVEIKGFQRNASINRYKMAVQKYPLFLWRMVKREECQWRVIR